VGRKKYELPEVEIVCTGNLSHEEQVKRAEKITDIFIDIAVKYHVDKIKESKGNSDK
jgi:hypothetical protein